MAKAYSHYGKVNIENNRVTTYKNLIKWAFYVKWLILIALMGTAQLII